MKPYTGSDVHPSYCNLGTDSSPRWYRLIDTSPDARAYLGRYLVEGLGWGWTMSAPEDFTDPEIAALKNHKKTNPA